MFIQRTVVSVISLEPIRIGGLEVYARELSNQLAARGWKSVICFETTPPGPVRDFLRLPNTELELLPRGQQANGRGALELAAILRRHRPRILHLQFTPLLSLYAWVAQLHSVEKVFFTDQASRPAGYRISRARWWKRAIARLMNRPFTGVIGISDYVCRCLAGSGYVPTAKIHRIYNATEPASDRTGSADRGQAFRARYGIPASRVLIVQVSWIIPEKGIMDLLEAARIALALAPDLHFAIVGEGGYRADFTRKACEMGIADHLTWTGLLDDPGTAGVFPAADIVCQMSRWEEAFGYVIAEAMVQGKPLVATRVGGIPELVREGETGFLVDPGDTAAMADRILRLARDPGLRSCLGEAGRNLAEAEFNIRKNVAALINLYGID